MARFWAGLVVALYVFNFAETILVRKDVEHLSPEDILNLQKALAEVNEDTSEKGYAAIASYHGYPPKCKLGDKDIACCIHGMPSFPQWHRLYTVQMEQALKEKGLGIGIPYWDWTRSLTHLPHLVNEQVFLDRAGGRAQKNVWYQGDININGRLFHTARAVDDRLFQQAAPGHFTDLFEQVLNALEYENYCQFEVQFEVAHNTIHFLVGGRNKYSMSHLEYTSYDPIFFLHHSQVDRIFLLYSQLRSAAGSPLGENCQGDCEVCDVGILRKEMQPFSWESNPFAITRLHSAVRDAGDVGVYDYKYDNLTLNGYDVDGIRALLREKASHDRAFATFRLNGLGTSANVRVKVCLPASEGQTLGHCEFAGDFFVLGGPLEMPWAFNKPYYFEITKTVEKLGVDLTDAYTAEAELYSVNGTKLSSDLLPHPYVSYRPAAGTTDPKITHEDTKEDLSVRKDIDRLTKEEAYELREALQKFENDISVDGYQAIAEFHGEPGKCPYPTDANRFACCIHGMPTFPHWHRLIVVQVEDALRRRGAPIGIPYWDWTKRNTHVPALAADEYYEDPYTNEQRHNPFHDAEIAFLGHDIHTSRDVYADLTQIPEYGDHTELFDAFLLALEQDNFCDFEIQFEIAHNLIHALVGGAADYGLGSLSYSAFDPLFYIHHSNVDRIWAIWTELQQYRKKPYKAHCAQSYVYQPLKPFAFHSPYNNNDKTYEHSTPTDIYDYEKELGYTFDNLEFGGMGIPELDDYINANLKARDRVFAGLILWGISTSAVGTIYVSTPAGEKYKAGRVAILGGPTEMPWRLDREYRHDITAAIDALGLTWSDPFEVTVELHALNGDELHLNKPFPAARVIYKRRQEPEDPSAYDIHIRKNVNELSLEEIQELRQAMTNLQEDKSNGAYQDLGRYHGTPRWCPTPDAEVKKSCCLHGMPTFPHWHRLWTVQAENALRRHGYTGAIPYWSWTEPVKQLPGLVNTSTYIDPSSNQEVHNPFFSAHIDDVNHDTVRSVRDSLFQQPAFGKYTDIAQQVLLALEQEDFCNFEVQFEIAHNFIHALVGGNEQFSMASLMYTAFDPLFYLHHSNTDRIWAVWQALQKYRGKPYNSANCAIGQLRKPLSPFGLSSDVNPDAVTREHAVPFQVFDYRTNFHYDYDHLEFNGLTISQLARKLEQVKSEDRVFAGFMLHGIGQSALVKFYICLAADDCNHLAGEFYILGDPNEMTWAYDRLYKYDITHQLEDLGLRYNDRYYITYEVYALDGTVISTDVFSKATVLRELGTSHLYGQEYRDAVTTASHVRRDLESLSKGEVESLRSAFLSIQQDKTYENIASFHGRPGLCQLAGRKIACCIHGMPTFPAWHRLYVEQVEEALLSRGSNVAVPYWEWTKPIQKLPALIADATYYNSRQQRFDPNPFFSGTIAESDAVTTRDPQPELFNNDYFYEQALFALEQDNFCDFEIQFEIVHNALHSWLGGRADYSFSSLDYSAFDPVFFLHHSNTDRIWAIWQELQRYRGLPYNEADCAINLMSTPLRPFSDDNVNIGGVTRRYSRPADTFDYRNHLSYEYDTLEFHGMNIQQLENLLKQRQENGRVFAGFLLHNIGLSADVVFYICVPSGPFGEENCNHKAGVFSILGGELEMPFDFDRLYKHDITNAVRDLGLKLDNAANFKLKVEILANNGSHLSNSVLPAPTILFVPGTHDRQEADGKVSSYLVRKEVNSLSPRESLSLVKALKAMQADTSGDGYQSIAAFHAVPPLCPNPEAIHRYACCLHGMATFPQWHRLYTVQVEDALRRHGALVGMPYWDWVRAGDALPRLLTDPTILDPDTGVHYENPFAHARIEFEHIDVERDVQADLFKRGPHVWDTWLYKQALYALEQEDYCDFEIQLEVAHNAIHSWIGGAKEHSMGHLHYASYDPAFFLHHSNTDRLWAVWQALQEYRGHNSKEANCALELMREPLKPFSFGSPYNLNEMTKEYSRPEDTFDYREHFHYRYDDLEFVGMNIPDLDALIKEHQEHDRVFAGFLLSGFGTSATVDFEICSHGECFEAGHFSLLGGAAEMPWHFDRLYKYEITDQLDEHDLRWDDQYEFKVHIHYIDGTELDSHLIPTPSVMFEPGKGSNNIRAVAPNHIRRNLNSLGERDISSLKAALYELQLDESNDGWASLASFHGAPARCPDPANPTVACCQHGMPTFPHWHRLFTLQVEQALRRHGSSIAIPYWDWCDVIDDLPEVFTKPDFYDVWKDEVYSNPFAHGYVSSENAYTVRDVQPEFYERSEDGQHSKLLSLVLTALEQTDYCDFEVQFEVMHNAIHYLVGGHQTYSLSSLEYSAYDPIFFIHHSFVDKIWVVWQELQKRRRLSYDRADCAINYMTEPMKPFSFEDLNLNKFTKDHAVPNTLFRNEDLGYVYDNLDIGGYNLDELEELIHERQSKPRVFAGFLLKGIKTSGSVVLQICPRNEECHYAGRFNLLGGPLEMPWAFDRLFKLDITSALKESGFKPEDVFDADNLFKLKANVYDVEGVALSLSSVMPEPTLIFEPAHGATKDVASTAIAGVGVRKDVTTLSESEIENLREALRRVMDDSGPNGFQNIASFHGKPLNRCTYEGHPIACCIHGMANFPQWHRLYAKQWEDALTAQGAQIGLPYWDWTTAFTALPTLVSQEENNPFHHGKIYNGEITTRAPRDQLFNDPEHGSESFFYRQALLMFEQTDYCNFEVQYEITHNAIHSWTGGRSPYGMSTLEYTAYDPLFLLHHSNVDRQFAIWQALQKYRKLPYNSANCAIQHLRQPMRPFSDDDNVNSVTRSHARAIDAFNYDGLNYQYDNLNFHGLSIFELNDELEKRKEHDRIFAEFLLHGIGTSADILFELCNAKNECKFAGTFAVLGGPSEMPWAFDRLFKYDVTQVFESMNLQTDSDYHFEVHITAVNGTELDSHLVRPPSVQFVPGVKGDYDHKPSEVAPRKDTLIRKDVNRLTLAETTDLRNALYQLQQDHGPNGFEAIAGFHGAPFVCPEGSGDKHPCCVHGMPTFPHWHRLLTVQFEQALKKKGAHEGIPYWDWTEDVHALPYLFGDETNHNPFYTYKISFNGHQIVRDVQDELYHPYQMDNYNHLYHLALDALEEDNFCDFEVQYEKLHNEIHALIGGHETYSMATLDYSAFDPFFMIHHSTMDRIWVIWQELQKLRHKPFNSALCIGDMLNEPLAPFSYQSVNKNDQTRANALPSIVFDSHRFGYEYDHLTLNGHSVEELYDIIESHKSETRYYKAGVPKAKGTSVSAEMSLVSDSGVEFPIGKTFLLGGAKEVPWAYERLWKFDITKGLKDAGLSADKPVKVHYKLTNYTGTPLFDDTDFTLLLEKPAHTDYDILIIPIGTTQPLPPKIVVKKGTRVKFIPVSSSYDYPVEDLDCYTNLASCVIPSFSYQRYALGETYALKPGRYYFASSKKDLCEEGRKIYIKVENE